jgi:hypothetical protein
MQISQGERGRHFGWVARLLLVATLLLNLFLFFGAGAAEASPANPIALGKAVVALNGPWKFHTGDDVRWAETAFDDSAWESVDLTPPADAHDGDVGLTGYVPGWQTRGHRGYSGYAWYRLRIGVEARSGEGLALVGPPYVDSAYQVFVNGRLLGEFGNFSSAAPTVYGIHRPKLFPLNPEAFSAENSNGSVIAIRVWMGPWMLADPRSGGIYIAPSLGTNAGALARYQAQRWECVRGYIVDAVEGLIFWVLALAVCGLIPFDRNNPAYRWLAAALVFVGIARANQAFFFWCSLESYQGIEIATGILMGPLSLAAWTMAWYHWSRPLRFAWLPATVGWLTLALMAFTTLRRSWFYGAFSPSFETALRYCSLSVRLAFLVLTLLVLFRVLLQPSRERWFVGAAMLIMSVALFASELSLIGIPGIWFPFGVGVSRTEYAYAIFDIALLALLLRRLYSFRVLPAGTNPIGG